MHSNKLGHSNRNYKLKQKKENVKKCVIIKELTGSGRRNAGKLSYLTGKEKLGKKGAKGKRKRRIKRFKS